MGQPVVTQTHHVVLDNDNSTYTSCTQLSTEDERYSIAPAVKCIVGLKLAVTNKNYGSVGYSLYHRINANAYEASFALGNSGLWVVDGLPTDGSQTTTIQMMTNDGGTFRFGFYEDSGYLWGANPTSMDIGEYECFACVQINPREVEPADTIDCQIRDGASEFNTYNQIDVFTVADFDWFNFIDQYGWRWYGDAASVDPDNVTGKAAENASYEVLTTELDTVFNLRIHCKFPWGSKAASRNIGQLQFSVDGGAWTNVTSSSSYVRTIAGTATDDLPCDARLLTSQGGTFTGGGVYDESTGVTHINNGENNSAGFETEIQFCIQFRSADLSGGETITFRLVDSLDNTALINVQGTVPQATIEAAGGTINNETLQDLNSAATTDSYIMEKKLRRDITDAITSDDTILPLRQTIRLILDTAAATDDVVPTYEKGATIVSRTLQDLNSIAVSDAPGQQRERDRESLETIDLNDLTEEERERIRLLLDEADLSYSAETRHKRTIEILDSWIGMTDAVDAYKQAAPKGGTFTDDFAVTDALLMEKSLIREALDTLTALDTAIILRERYPAIIESLGATDAIEVFRDVQDLTIDTASLSDATIELRERNRLLIDALATADAILTRLERNRTLLDSVAVTDNVDATYIPRAGEIFEKNLSDLITVTEILIALRERYRVTADSVATIDAIERLTERPRNIFDSLTSTDDAIELRERYRQAADTLGVADATDSETERRRSVLDAIGVAEDDVELRQRYRLLTDTITALDSVIVTSTGLTSRTLSDLIGVIDTATTLRQNYREQADGIDLADSVKREIFNWSVFTDIADLTDNEVALRERYRTLTESITVLDSVIAEAEGVITRTLTDTLAATDLVETLRLLEREIADNAELADLLAPERLRERLTSDDAALTDAIEWAKVKAFLTSDSFDFADFLTRILARGRLVTDPITLVDSYTATYLPEGILTYYKTVAEALRITDSALGQHIYPLIDFIIRHSIKRMTVEHDIERFHIRHNVEQKT